MTQGKQISRNGRISVGILLQDGQAVVDNLRTLTSQMLTHVGRLRGLESRLLLASQQYLWAQRQMEASLVRRIIII